MKERLALLQDIDLLVRVQNDFEKTVSLEEVLDLVSDNEYDGVVQAFFIQNYERYKDYAKRK